METSLRQTPHLILDVYTLIYHRQILSKMDTSLRWTMDTSLRWIMDTSQVDKGSKYLPEQTVNDRTN